MSKKHAVIFIALWLAVFLALASLMFWLFTPCTTHPVFAVAFAVLFSAYFTSKSTRSLVLSTCGRKLGRLWDVVFETVLGPPGKQGEVDHGPRAAD
jgi:uncharacterized protein (DUF2062 family)